MMNDDERREHAHFSSDLLAYVLQPPFIQRKMRNKPPDVGRFVALLNSIGSIPRSSFNAPKTRKRRAPPPSPSVTPQNKQVKWLL